MKAIKKLPIWRIVLCLIILTALCVFLTLTIKKQNDKDKNTVLFVMDNLYYENVYTKQQKELKAVFKKHYARPITMVYNIYKFSYENFQKELSDNISLYAPSHVVFSPISAVYVYKNNTSPEIAKHTRSRARLISLSAIEQTGFFDAAYSVSSEEEASLLASIINAQSENIAFIYNSFNKEGEGRSDETYINSIRNDITKDVLYIDEGLREAGEIEAKELIDSVFTGENAESTPSHIIATTGFKNLPLFSYTLKNENKNALFIGDASIVSSLPLEQQGAVIETDLATLVDKILDEVNFENREALKRETIPLRVKIINKKIHEGNNSQ